MQAAQRRFALIVGAHILLGFLFLAPGYIRPDSVAVYSWLRSVVFDGDLLFFNEWQGFGMIVNHATSFKEITPTGALANHWWIGTSIAVAFPYLMATAVAAVFRLPGAGFFGIWAATLAWCSVLFTSVAIALTDRLATLEHQTERLLVPVAILLGTPLFWYTFRFPLGTHAAGTLAVAVLIWLLLRQNGDSSGYSIGLAAGLATAIRLQHAVLIAAVLALALLRRWPLKSYFRFGLGFAVVMTTQAIAWWQVYGSPLGPLTTGANLTGVTWMPFHTFRFLPVLFSSYHGLFSWSPVTLLSVVGLLLALRTGYRQAAFVLLVAFAAELIANAAFDRYFWGGLSFGPRRFVDLAPVFALGLVWFIQLFPRRFLGILLVLATMAWSVGLTIAAMAGHLELARYVSAADLINSLTASPSPDALRSPVTDGRLLIDSIAAIMILAVVATGMWILRRHAVVAATVYLLGWSILLVAVWPPTLDRADEAPARFHIDPVKASRWGPLADQRRLLQDELDFLRANGRLAEARATEQEIRQVDAALGQLEKTGTVD